MHMLVVSHTCASIHHARVISPSHAIMLSPPPSDETTMVLYKDLYFRHIYAKMQPTVDDRFDSFQNYIDLFNLILGADTEVRQAACRKLMRMMPALTCMQRRTSMVFASLAWSPLRCV